MALPTLKEFRTMKGDLVARIYGLAEKILEEVDTKIGEIEIPEAGASIPGFSVESISGSVPVRSEIEAVLGYFDTLELGYRATIFDEATGATFLIVIIEVGSVNNAAVFEGAIAST